VPESHDAPAIPSRSGRGWQRAAALAVATATLALVHPFLLIGVPFLALALVLGASGGVLVAAGVVGVVVVGGWAQADATWLVERGWSVMVAGWFVALTLKRPRASLSDRAIFSVLGAALASAMVFRMRPGSWSAVEWVFSERILNGVGMAVQTFRAVLESNGLTSEQEALVYESAQLNAQVFPAILGLATVSALGVAWWVYVRLRTGGDQGIGPLVEFRFNDHLIWLFIGGLALVMARWGNALVRVGTNGVVFMSGLYAVRGVAVALFMSGGLSLVGFLILVPLVLLFGSVVLPLLITGALVIGVSDTWLDVRTRVRSMVA